MDDIGISDTRTGNWKTGMEVGKLAFSLELGVGGWLTG